MASSDCGAPTGPNREMRPTSPHNVSSPGRLAGFLAVPSSRRSRAPTITIDANYGITTLDTNDGTNNEGPSSKKVETAFPAVVPPKEVRPTSPHNVSSPVCSQPAGGFSVPNTSRTRAPTITIDITNDGTDDGTDDKAPSYINTNNPSVNMRPSNHVGIVGSSFRSEEPPRNRAHTDMYAVDDNTFAFSPGQLNKMFNPKSLCAFWTIGALSGLEKGLRTDRKIGLSVAEPGDTRTARKSVFGRNVLPEKKPRTLPELLWSAFNDPVLLVLTTAAMISIAIGFRQSSAGFPDDWGEGIVILTSVTIVVLVGAMSDWQKERQFAKLNARKEDRLVRVVRSGKTTEISVFDILVGDVLTLEPGDLIPVDGVLISGHNVICDESCMTGESDLIKKTPGEAVINSIVSGEDPSRVDPFILSGTRVMEGIGTFMVTSVGAHSIHGGVLMSLSEGAPEPTAGLLSKIAVGLSGLGAGAGLYCVGNLALRTAGTAAPTLDSTELFLQSMGRAVAYLLNFYSSLDVACLVPMLGFCFITIRGALEAISQVKAPTDASCLRHQLTLLATVVVLFSLLSPGPPVAGLKSPVFWVNLIMDTFAALALATIATNVIWSLPSDMQSTGRNIGRQSIQSRLATLLRMPAQSFVIDKHKSSSITQGLSMITWTLFGLLLLIGLISGVITESPGRGLERNKSLPDQVHWQELVLIATFLSLHGAMEWVSTAWPDCVLLFLLHAPRDSWTSPHGPTTLLLMGAAIPQAGHGLPPDCLLLLLLQASTNPWISLHIPMMLLVMNNIFLRGGTGLPPNRVPLMFRPPPGTAADLLKLCSRVNLNPWNTLDGLFQGLRDHLVLFMRRVTKATRRRIRSRSPGVPRLSSPDPSRVGGSRVLWCRTLHDGGTPLGLGGSAAVAGSKYG